MRWPPLIGLGLYSAFVATTWAGLPAGVPWLDRRAADLDVIVFKPNIAYPSMLLVAIGFGLGFYGPQIVNRLVTKKTEHNTFRESHRAARSSKTNFWNLISRAYRGWGDAGADMPDDIEGFTDDFKEMVDKGRIDEFVRRHKVPQGRNQHSRARERFERVLDLACRGALERKQEPGKH